MIFHILGLIRRLCPGAVRPAEAIMIQTINRSFIFIFSSSQGHFSALNSQYVNE
jgi:hypothetical protein